jgi:8-oxo-dGTP diphosphatase
LFSIGAFVVILDGQNRVLLCHRRDMDLWNLPGGGAEGGELPTETAVREVREETGLDVIIDRLTGVYGKVNQDELVFTFTAQVIGGDLVKTDESDDARYFDIQALPVNIIPKHIERIHDAVERQETVIRTQTAPSGREWLRILNQDDSESSE